MGQHSKDKAIERALREFVRTFERYDDALEEILVIDSESNRDSTMFFDLRDAYDGAKAALK